MIVKGRDFCFRCFWFGNVTSWQMIVLRWSANKIFHRKILQQMFSVKWLLFISSITLLVYRRICLNILVASQFRSHDWFERFDICSLTHGTDHNWVYTNRSVGTFRMNHHVVWSRGIGLYIILQLFIQATSTWNHVFSFVLSRTMQGSYWYRRSPGPKRCIICLFKLQLQTWSRSRAAEHGCWSW